MPKYAYLKRRVLTQVNPGRNYNIVLSSSKKIKNRGKNVISKFKISTRIRRQWINSLLGISIVVIRFFDVAYPITSYSYGAVFGDKHPYLAYCTKIPIKQHHLFVDYYDFKLNL